MNSAFIQKFESPRFTDGFGMRYESNREMTYDSIEVFGMSNWMNGVAIIEMGKTDEKRKVVSGKQAFSLP